MFFFLPLSSSLEVWILFDSILSFLPAFLTKETSTNKRRDIFFHFFFPLAAASDSFRTEAKVKKTSKTGAAFTNFIPR